MPSPANGRGEPVGAQVSAAVRRRGLLFVGAAVATVGFAMALQMGVATSHVAAVLMPLLGGFLWQWLGYQWAFLIGAAAAALSIGVASLVPRHGIPARTPPAG